MASLKKGYLILLFAFAADSYVSHTMASTRLQQYAAANGCFTQPISGAARFDSYIPYLRDKRVGMVVNSNSLVNGRHVVDTLIAQGITVVRLFTPERHVGISGLPQVRLYGAQEKPSESDLADIDVMVFDAQDIGVRFYIYLHTLHYVMEACARYGLELLVLDRPNPMGGAVDGPIMDMDSKHPLGMHPVPILHGMTMAEYAKMINGEGWLADGRQCPLRIVSMLGYRRDIWLSMANPPFPNLNSERALLLYPSLCLFDGTLMSQGRGTCAPFTVLGHPGLKGRYQFSFTPVSTPGMSEHPPYEGQPCYGLNLDTVLLADLLSGPRLNLSWLLQLYRDFPDKTGFFNPDKFDRLAGTVGLRQQILAGTDERTIRQSWEPALASFKQKRKQYLLYETDDD